MHSRLIKHPVHQGYQVRGGARVSGTVSFLREGDQVVAQQQGARRFDLTSLCAAEVSYQSVP
ncbi:MAG: hypothetical protein IT555_21660 [Acetobacteraceae bacterium]|nr:hypothetical protein [Acetobacteraceae bacterium]